jgi:hypothetical protein
MGTSGSFPGGKAAEAYLHSPNTPSWRGAQLKHRDNFTFRKHEPTSKQNGSKHTIHGPQVANVCFNVAIYASYLENIKQKNDFVPKIT